LSQGRDKKKLLGQIPAQFEGSSNGRLDGAVTFGSDMTETDPILKKKLENTVPFLITMR